MTKPKSKVSGRRIVVRHSKIHGNGVFAAQKIPSGERLIEYKGKRMTHAAADKLYGYDPEDDKTHTFLFIVDEKMLLDANVGGNSSRWINHSCDPNCQSMDEDGRIYIETIRDIKAGEELLYDYRMTIDERYTAAVKARYKCLCGAKNCRGTMLYPKR
jgi:uncharacterized protein